MADADIDETVAVDGGDAGTEDEAAIAEWKLARAVAIGLPLATLALRDVRIEATLAYPLGK
jgi:hypothetical protein